MSQGTTVLGISELAPPSTVVGMAELGLPKAWLAAYIIVVADAGSVVEVCDALSASAAVTELWQGTDHAILSATIIRDDAGTVADVRELLQSLFNLSQEALSSEQSAAHQAIITNQDATAIELSAPSVLIKTIEQVLTTETSVQEAIFVSLDGAAAQELFGSLAVDISTNQPGSGDDAVIWVYLYKVGAEDGVGADEVARRLIEALASEYGTGSEAPSGVEATIVVFEVGGDGTEEQIYVAVFGAPWGWLHFRPEAVGRTKDVGAPAAEPIEAGGAPARRSISVPVARKV